MTRIGRRLWLRSRELAVPRQPPRQMPTARTRPRLRVYRAAPGWWYWDLDHGDGTGQGASAPTQPAALAVGLAALEVATARWERLP